MSAYTLANFRTYTQLRLGNLDTADPFYTNRLDGWINAATNAVVLRAISKAQRSMLLFPELRDKWKDTTIAAQSYVSKATDCLVVTHCFSFDKTSANVESDDREPMTEITDPVVWELLPKTAEANWPRLWNKYGNRIQVYPTPTAAKVSDILYLGLAKENDMSGTSDTPVMSDLWHPAVVDMAVYIAATEMGWESDAQLALAACDQKLAMNLSIMGLERSTGDAGVKVQGDPTR